MHVGIIAFLQESNTFVSEPTTFRHFEQELLVQGAEMQQRLRPAHHEVGGFFAGLAAAAIEAVPIFAARALPFGVIQADDFDRLMTMLFDAVAKAGKLDGYLVAPHGATVSERYPDADGYWLTRLRQHVGAAAPIIGTLDPHANLSPAMVQATDALIAYRTNPHVDQRQRGVEAATLMARTLRGEVQPVQAAAFPPLAINIERQCTEEAPLRELYVQAEELAQIPGVLSRSIVLGFPYADVPEMGSAALVVTNGDKALAQQLAGTLASALWERRHELVGTFIAAEAAVAQALTLEEPVCLLDMGDNVGGGSPADGTVLAHVLHNRGVERSFVCLYDPQTVATVEQLGAGATTTLMMGGKTDALHGPPLTATCTILSLHDGIFTEAQPRHGGLMQYDMGCTAVVRTSGGVTIMLTTRRTMPWSLQQFTHCGLKPADFHILVAKGVNAPLAAYREVCRSIIRVDTPGVTSADMRRLPYQKRRRPLFPLEEDTVFARFSG